MQVPHADEDVRVLGDLQMDSSGSELEVQVNDHSLSQTASGSLFVLLLYSFILKINPHRDPIKVIILQRSTDEDRRLQSESVERTNVCVCV